MSYPRMVFNEVMKRKVKDVPAYLQGELKYSNIAPKVEAWKQNYRKTYIEKGSIMPIYHVCIGVFALSYTIGWPSEKRHMDAAEEAAGGVLLAGIRG
eukprot:CAMPEP_0182900872 /NCGR_PEP_ID=MMETSP0034_2-20130328/29199_1 /TAXON_ID=156128 /ORGANISM="Nephroselmis pyriformis, Strain CCMP717" /LENGTH=96 /DNA_ID=CAMNT_0025035165 /DNA_START=24 /DNA_END=311 /DNA_ORIENTATION=-